MFYIGGHYSSINSYAELISVIRHTIKNGGNILQIFAGNDTATTTTPHQKLHLTPEEKANIREICRLGKLAIFIHASLTLNLANPLTRRYQWVLDNLLYDMELGRDIGAIAVVVHLGSIFSERYDSTNLKSKSADEIARNNMAKSMIYVLDKCSKIKLLIETGVGKRNQIATNVEDLAILYGRFPPKYRRRVGFCLDTCHIYADGYDISTIVGWRKYMELFSRAIGFRHIHLIHLNDSAKELDSHRNLHAGLLKGYLFKEHKDTLRDIVKMADKYSIPIILETGYPSGYRKEIKLIRQLAEK